MSENAADNFCGLEADLADFNAARVAVLPIPYEATTTWGRGTAGGPRAIIEASQNLELFDEELFCDTSSLGIHTAAPVEVKGAPEESVGEIERRCGELLDAKKFVVGLGGEHAITIGLARAHAARHKHLTVLQLDAHADLRDSYEGEKYSHACVMRRVLEVCPITQVGIRSISEEEAPLLKNEDVRTFFAHKIRTMPAWAERVADTLAENVYISIDIDVFDPSIVPGTGTPEPGGLNWWQVTGLLRQVCSRRKVVGFDINEVMPLAGERSSEFTAAKLAYRLLGYIFMAPRDPHLMRAASGK